MARLDPRRALSAGDQALRAAASADACGEVYKGSTFGRPFFREGFVPADECRRADKPPLHELLTALLLAPPPDAPPAAPPAAPPKEPVMDFDDLLPYVGEFGLYQKFLFLMMAPFAFFVAFVYFAQIFITLLPSGHWCRVPQLEGLNLTREQRLELAIPKLENGKFDSCHMYAIDDYGALLQEGPEAAAAARREAARSAVVPCRYGWEFDLDEVPYLSIAAEYEWVCEDNVLPTVAQALFFCGSMAGGLVFGWMADRYGRVPALVGTNMIGFVAGLATYFVTNFWQFCVCRFVLGLAFDNCFTMMYILVLEYVGLKWRTFVANMSIAIYFTIATCMLPWIAYWIADWRLLCIATSAPLGIVLFAPFVVPESARWLVSQGRVDEAITIMKKFEKVNGKKVDPAVYEEFKDCVKKLQMEDELQDKTYSVLDLFRTPRLRRFTLLMIIIWGCISISFDGHVRNVTALGLDVFLTFTVACAAELPADTLLTLTLDRWGRRWLAFGTLAASGIFSILAGVVPLGIPSASLAIVGRFSINITYNIGLQYAAELLPTVVRAQGVALVHIIGYAATIVAPFVVYLGYYSPVLPFVILGVIGVFGAALCLFLPETLNEELPLTLQDGESFGMGQKFCEFPCLKKPEAQHVEPTLSMPNSGFARMSMRGSIRGEMYRSRKIQIHRNSVIRRSVRSNNAAPAAPVPTVQIESESSVKT